MQEFYAWMLIALMFVCVCIWASRLGRKEEKIMYANHAYIIAARKFSDWQRDNPHVFVGSSSQGRALVVECLKTLEEIERLNPGQQWVKNARHRFRRYLTKRSRADSLEDVIYEDLEETGEAVT